jgi:hypothetical protein
VIELFHLWIIIQIQDYDIGMKKQTIVDITGKEVMVKLPAISGVHPIGSQVLVELLTPQEIMGTSLHINSESKTLNGAPQAYVLEVGPAVDPNWGIRTGQRVVLQGTFVPLPEAASLGSHRPKATVDPHTIKAILVEEGV